LVQLGVGVTGIPNLTAANFLGLNASDVTTAQNILANLAGSVSAITQQYFVNSNTQTNWSSYVNGDLFYRDNHSNAWSAFFKDNWKVTRSFTVNLGVRYDWYGTPYEDHGLGGKFTGGAGGLFGISGTSFATAGGNRFQTLAPPTTIEFTGPNSTNPGDTVYNNDNASFAPSIGISWQLPWFKKSTVLRAGYGINFVSPLPDFLAINANIGNLPGQTLNTTAPLNTYVSVQSLASTGLIPVATGGALPFTPVPFTNRTASIAGYDTNLRNPYIQVFNVTLQRELTRTLTMDLSYIGNKATKLQVSQQINDVDITNNGFLTAFNTVRAGGDSALFDAMLNGYNIPGVGVVGQTVTGSQALRRYTTTNAFIANGQVGSLANFFNTTAALSGTPGGILRNAHLPENFIVSNPQFGSVGLVGNNGNSSYHSAQAHIAERFSHGLSGQFAYTFSKTLGDSGLARDQNNYALNKSLLSIDRTHVIQQNFTYALPFGKGGAYFSHVNNWVDEAIGGWQVSSGMTWVSGAPLSFTALNTLNQYGSATANLIGALPSGYESVIKGNGFVTYFPTLSTKAAPVPNFGTGTDATTLAGRYTNQIIVDQNGNTILANANPGSTGNTANNLPQLRGPGQLSFNGAASKVFKIKERVTMTVRADVINLLNKPQWGNPVTNINSTTFGRITTATGNRTVTLNARIDF
jgi:hypothetical protein